MPIFELMYRRIIQVGKDLRMSLAQPPAQSRASCEIRPTYSRFIIQSGLENLYGQRLNSPSRQPAPLPECPHSEKVYFLCLVRPFHFNLCLFLVCLPCTTPNSPAPSS